MKRSSKLPGSSVAMVEVYQVKELLTGVEHAAKFFFPHRNIANKAVKFHAKEITQIKKLPCFNKIPNSGNNGVQG